MWPLDRLGVSILKSKPLRRLANTQSYFDGGQFATEEAMLIGRLPCLTDGGSIAHNPRPDALSIAGEGSPC